MRKEELTELEIAKIQSHNSQIENLQNKMRQIQGKMQKHQEGLNNILNQIKERVDIDEDFPVDRMNFSGVNWEEFEGPVMFEDDSDGDR
jgi:hypothetical protein